MLVVPDGAINLVNLTTLPTAEDRYLVETGPAVHVLSTERDVVREAKPEPAKHDLLALGNPDFDFEPAPLSPEILELARLDSTAVTDHGGEEVYRGPRGNCEGLGTMRFGPLPRMMTRLRSETRVSSSSS